MLYNETLHVISLNTIPLNAIPLDDYKKVCNSCTIYIVLFATICSVFFITSICICSVFIYFHWYLKEDDVKVKFNPDI